MVPRTDGCLLLLTSLVTLGTLGCAQIPLQPTVESPVQRAAVERALHRNSGAAPAVVQAGASGPAPLGSSPSHGGPPPEGTPPAATSSPANDPSAKLHALYRDAAERHAHMDSYIVRLTRREQLNGKDKPEEILLMKFRKDPWSVYFKWIGPEGKGREVVYVRGQHENKIHSLLAAGDIPLMPAGKRFAVAPDNPIVLSSSRHPIQQAGVGMLIERFGKWLEENDRHGQGPGTLKYLGPIQRPEFSGPAEAVEQTIPAGMDPQLPRGGRRLWVFDPQTKLPALIITHDDTGHEVEYYCYDRLESPVRLDDDDFNPDKLWNRKSEGPPKG